MLVSISQYIHIYYIYIHIGIHIYIYTILLVVAMLILSVVSASICPSPAFPASAEGSSPCGQRFLHMVLLMVWWYYKSMNAYIWLVANGIVANGC